MPPRDVELEELRAYWPDVELYGPLLFLKPEMVRIGAKSRIDSFCKIEGGEGIHIGVGVHVASFSHLGGGGGSLIIEDYVGLASGSKILSGTNDPTAISMSASAPHGMMRVKKALTRLKRYAFVGTNAVVMPGVTLQEGALLGAGSVATKDIPAWEVWAGVPARRLRRRNTL